MYSEDYEKRWAELTRWHKDLLIMTACLLDGHPPADAAEYRRWSRHDLQRAILRSEFPAEASNG